MKFSQFINEAEKKQILKKYLVSGNSFKPVGDIKTIMELDSGIYKINSTMEGINFEIHEVHTDQLLTFKDPRYNQIVNEIQTFWGLGENFKKMGMTHKRGVLLYGKPGCGKSCLLKQIMEGAVSDGNIVLIVKDPYTLVKGLKELKEVESSRKVLIVFEDIDEAIRHGGERPILELFDGDSQSNNVLYLATTNYVDQLPERMLRANRFDRKIEVGNPPREGRKAYFEHKLKGIENDARILELSDKTDGFTFAQLREFVVATYCLKQNEDEVIKRLKANLEPMGKVELHNSPEVAYEKVSEAELDGALKSYVKETTPKSDVEFLKEFRI